MFFLPFFVFIFSELQRWATYPSTHSFLLWCDRVNSIVPCHPRLVYLFICVVTVCVKECAHQSLVHWRVSCAAGKKERNRRKRKASMACVCLWVFVLPVCVVYPMCVWPVCVHVSVWVPAPSVCLCLCVCVCLCVPSVCVVLVLVGVWLVKSLG